MADHPAVEDLVASVQNESQNNNDMSQARDTEVEHATSSNESIVSNVEALDPFDGEDGGEDIIGEDDADDYDPGGTGAGISIPGDIPAETGFLARFAERLNNHFK